MNMTLFDKIDAYYAKKDKKEFLYTILAIVLAVGFVIFYFITPDIFSFEKKSEKHFIKITRELKQDIIMINGLKGRSIRMQKELKKIKRDLIALNKDKVFYSQLVNLLDFAKFNTQDWALFVKNSILDATNMGLNVESVKNQFVKENILNRINSNIINLKQEINNLSDIMFFVNENTKQYYVKKIDKLKKKITQLEKEKKEIIQIYKNRLINPKMLFGLKLKGKYRDFIYFMYKYENIKPLIRVDNFKIQAPDKYYIEFHLYGFSL